MKATLFVICAGMVGVAFEGFAMPTEEAAARAESVVQKLLESEQEDANPSRRCGDEACRGVGFRGGENAANEGCGRPLRARRQH